MNRGKGQISSRLGGYTIVETLIFLAVSSAVFFAAMRLISGQQGRAQFVNAVRDFETRLADVANDVSTGYYQNGVPLNCSATSTGPNTVAGITPQGQNIGCIFAGTVVKFGQGSSVDNRSKFTQFTMAGLRIDPATGDNSTSLVAAKPKVVNVSGAHETVTLPYGTRVQCVAVGSSCSPVSNANGALGFFTRFSGVTPSGGSSIQTDVKLYPVVSLNSLAASEVNNINSASYVTGSLNPGAITICLRSSTSSQYALIHIGAGGSNLTFSNEIRGGSSCA